LPERADVLHLGRAIMAFDMRAAGSGGSGAGAGSGPGEAGAELPHRQSTTSSIGVTPRATPPDGGDYLFAAMVMLLFLFLATKVLGI
jgi:hypothetical protein